MSDNQEKHEKSPIRDNLEKQFQQLNADLETPEDLKNEVFNTLDSLTLFGDIVDLFTAKFIDSESILLDTITNPEEKNESSKDETP